MVWCTIWPGTRRKKSGRIHPGIIKHMKPRNWSRQNLWNAISMEGGTSIYQLFRCEQLGARLTFRRESKWRFDHFHIVLKSSQFHWNFCLVFVEYPQKLCFSLLQNAGKLARSSPNFGELPQNNLCRQVAPSPRVDLACEKGTEGLCVWIFHQLLFGQVVSASGPPKSDPHT